MSQKSEILYWLQRGNTLTPLEALEKFGVFRLSGRILELRLDGYDIVTEMIEVGEDKHVARYSLKPKIQFPVDPHTGQLSLLNEVRA